MTNKTKEILEIAYSCWVGLAAGGAIFYWAVHPLILWVARVYYGQK